jgi:hypothetical protein
MQLTVNNQFLSDSTLCNFICTSVTVFCCIFILLLIPYCLFLKQAGSSLSTLLTTVQGAPYRLTTQGNEMIESSSVSNTDFNSIIPKLEKPILSTSNENTSSDNERTSKTAMT